MSITPAMLARLRRMVAEPDTTTYDDAALTSYLEAAVVTDRDTIPALQAGAWGDVTDVQYVPQPAVYDLHAAAAVIWEEKLAALIGAGTYDISVDGRSLSLGQKVQQYHGRMTYHLARRRVKSIRQIIKRAPGPLTTLTTDINVL